MSPKGLLRLLCAGDTENSKQPGFYIEPENRPTKAANIKKDFYPQECLFWWIERVKNCFYPQKWAFWWTEGRKVSPVHEKLHPKMGSN